MKISHGGLQRHGGKGMEFLDRIIGFEGLGRILTETILPTSPHYREALRGLPTG